MAFKQKVADLLAYRSGYICNNPDCNVLTIGPASSDPHLKTKTGEAAHILGEKPGAARYKVIDKEIIESDKNGIWLCVACHTLIDKNNGIDYHEDELFKWKQSHEELMEVLLRTHRSPLPLVRRFSLSKKIAQDIVDTLGHKGVMFQPATMENTAFALKSIDQIRLKLMRHLRDIDLDKRLKDICNNLINAFREVMNENSKDPSGLFSYLEVLRIKVGRLLYQLQQEYGCQISGHIVNIVRP